MNCNADETNSFYGNRGALKCLHETGDVAILELQYLNGMKLILFFHYTFQYAFFLSYLFRIIIGIAKNSAITKSKRKEKTKKKD